VNARRPAAGPRAAVGFLTVLGGAAPLGPAALAWFGVVGALLGAAVGGARWGLDGATGPLLAAALAVGLDLALTGLLHVDGLADTADGLLPPLPRDRRLEVMRRPDVGAFGVAVIVGVLLVRWSAFASLAPTTTTIAGVAAVWAATRAAMVAVLLTRPHARPDGGLPARFGTARRGATLVAGAVPVVLCATLGGVGGVAAVAAALLTAVLVVAGAQRKIGGYTGDVLGALGVLGETAGLVALVVWQRVG